MVYIHIKFCITYIYIRNTQQPDTHNLSTLAIVTLINSVHTPHHTQSSLLSSHIVCNPWKTSMAAGPEAGGWVQRNPQSWGLRASGRAGQHGTGSNHSSPPTPIASPTLKAHTQTALRQFPGTRLLRDSEVRVGWEEGGCPGGFLGLHRNRQAVGCGERRTLMALVSACSGQRL